MYTIGGKVNIKVMPFEIKENVSPLNSFVKSRVLVTGAKLSFFLREDSDGA